jgi:hypothetical protein
VLFLAILVLSKAGTGVCQDPAPIGTDTRVRLKAVGADHWLVGRLLAPPTDSLTLITDAPGDSVSLPVAGLARLEASRGRGSRAGQGARLGAGIGAILGLLLGAVTSEECNDCIGPDPGAAGGAVLGALLGGVFGLGLGALVGWPMHGERWAPVPEPWGRTHSLEGP